MRRLPILVLLLTAIGALCGCNSNDDNNSQNYWSKYSEWREANTDFFNRMRDSLDADGRLFYSVLYPTWNPSAEILIHYYNDRNATAGNLQPLYNSTCAVRYYGKLYNDVAFDSSYAEVDSIRNFQPAQTIDGWAIALQDMHVGDSCQIVIPYALGYGGAISSDGVVLPYSTLIFNMGLVDIPYYEIRP